jgi:hypothetical protein
MASASQTADRSPRSLISQEPEPGDLRADAACGGATSGREYSALCAKRRLLPEKFNPSQCSLEFMFSNSRLATPCSPRQTTLCLAGGAAGDVTQITMQLGYERCQRLIRSERLLHLCGNTAWLRADL